VKVLLNPIPLCKGNWWIGGVTVTSHCTLLDYFKINFRALTRPDRRSTISRNVIAISRLKDKLNGKESSLLGFQNGFGAL
jgi:hypothetical protein